MGVDTRIMLPGDVRVRDVASAIGILAGLPMTKEPLGHSFYYVVPGAKVECCGVPEACNIILNGKMVDGENNHRVMFHFEPDGLARLGAMRLLMPRSTPFWIAVGRGLVQFFGGMMDYADCDNSEVDYIQPPQRINNPSDGEPWEQFRTALAAIAPLTRFDLVQANQLAVYKDGAVAVV